MLRKATKLSSLFKQASTSPSFSQPYSLFGIYRQQKIITTTHSARMRESAPQVRAVSFDGAGTTALWSHEVTQAMVTAFKNHGFVVSEELANSFTGVDKPTHIRLIMKDTTIKTQFLKQNNRQPTDEDFTHLYSTYLSIQANMLKHSQAVPGLKDLFAQLRERKILIGLNTAYSALEAQIFVQTLAKQGVEFDYKISVSDVPTNRGRPYPDMLHQTCEFFGLKHRHNLMVVGDTKADIEAANNGGYYSIGAAGYGALLGVTSFNLGQQLINSGEINALRQQSKSKLKSFGAKDCIVEPGELLGIIEKRNRYLQDQSESDVEDELDYSPRQCKP